MDFTQFEVVTDKPMFVQFNHPFTGDPLFDQMPDPEDPTKTVDNPEKPIGVNLFGQDSEPFAKRRRYLLDQQVKRAQLKQSNKVQIDLEAEGRSTVIACVHSFQNVDWEGQPLDERRDQYEAFFLKHKWAFDFCNLAVTNRANFQKASSTS